MLEGRSFIDLSKYVSIVGNPYFIFRKNDALPDHMQLGFDTFYLRTEFKNIGIQFGRDELAWGQGAHGGLVQSVNTTSLDMFKISNVHPFRFPWVFKYLGPSQITAYFTVLEPNRDFAHPYIVGWKYSFQPHRNFEFGLTQAVISGGEGSPSSSMAKRVADSFGIFAALAGQDPAISNRVGGFDLRWRFPFLAGMQLYYEILMEDTQSPSHWDLMFKDEAIHHVGLFFPKLNRE